MLLSAAQLSIPHLTMKTASPPLPPHPQPSLLHAGCVSTRVAYGTPKLGRDERVKGELFMFGRNLLLLACGVATATADNALSLAAYRTNPSKYESRALESLNGALDRLLQRGQRRRWPWTPARDPALMQPGPGAWRRQGDALRILVQVWRHRDDPIFLPGACESLAELANDERAMDELELYVPQLAYIILGLPADSLLSSVLERFALRLCETNAHWALQLSWNAYAALEDNRPGGSLGVHGDPEAYSRAARLLQLIEQSIVYGAKMVNRDSLRSAALAHNIELWRQRVLARVQKLADDVQQLAEHVVPPHTREGEGALPTSVPSSQPVGSGGGHWCLLIFLHNMCFDCWFCCCYFFS